MKRWRLAILAMLATSSFAGPNRWTSSGLGAPWVTRLVADPDRASVVYALTAAAGLYKTTNGGESWAAANDGLPSTSISAFDFVSDQALFAAVGNNIFSSSDGAKHWMFLGHIEESAIAAIAFDPASRTLYVGTYNGVYASSDGGRTWVAPPLLMHDAYVQSISVSGLVTYALIYPRLKGAEIVSTSDSGRTWNIRGTPNGFNLVAGNGSLYAISDNTVFESSNGGNDWHPLPGLPETIRSLLPISGGLLASGQHAVYEYRSGKWNRVTSSFSDSLGYALALTSSAPRRFYATRLSGIDTVEVVATTEGDAPWTSASNGFHAYAFDVAMLSSEPLTAYAATNAGVFKTDDGGASWRNSGLGLTTHVDVSKDGTVYAMNRSGIEKSNDGGATWTEVRANPLESNFPGTALAISPSKPSTMYAALIDALYQSSDGGDNWHPIMSGIDPDLYLGGYFFYYGVSAIAVDPSDSSDVYMCVNRAGLYRTTNGGDRWTPISSISTVRALAIEPSDSPVVYAGPDDGGVLASADGGATWSVKGLLDKHVTALTIADGLLYAGTADGHLYRSPLGSKTWRALENGLTRASITRISGDSSHLHVYAATADGVYTYHAIDDELRVRRTADPSQFDDALVFPVVGAASGFGGEFTTDVTLSNTSGSAQDLLLFWLGAGGGAFRMTLPPSPDPITLHDIADLLGVKGIGSLVLLASGSNTTEWLSGSADIWTLPADDRAPFSQSIPALRSSLYSDYVAATASGLREDAAFRSNIGIVNLATEAHQFTISIDGERASNRLTMTVPPLSVTQTPIPIADYGNLSVTATSDTPTRWVLYGSTIENAISAATTTIGLPQK